MITIRTRVCLICSHIEICNCSKDLQYWMPCTMDEDSFNKVKNIQFNPNGERSEIQTPLALFLEARQKSWNNRPMLK